jgi:hypothetical protein
MSSCIGHAEHGLYVPKPDSANVLLSSEKIHSSWSRLMMRLVVWIPPYEISAHVKRFRP